MYMVMKKLLEKGMGFFMEIFSILLRDKYRLVFHYLYETGETVLDVVKFGDVPQFMSIDETPDTIKREISEITNIL